MIKKNEEIFDLQDVNSKPQILTYQHLRLDF